MPENGNGKFVTIKWLVGAMVGLLLTAYGVIVADTRTNIDKNKMKIEALADQKVDKEQYYRDITDIKDFLKSIDGKIERHMDRVNR